MYAPSGLMTLNAVIAADVADEHRPGGERAHAVEEREPRVARRRRDGVGSGGAAHGPGSLRSPPGIGFRA